jgi:RNA polymerase sigma-70 factor (ECF subfamily)
LEAISDQTVIENAIKGDQEAFSILYERYVVRIYNYIYYRVGNTHDAEDITARVFYRAMGGISRYDNRGVPFSAWLYRIAHNLVANWYRDNARKKEVSLEEVGQFQQRSEHLESVMVQTQENEKLIKAIRSLPPDRQQLIILKLVEDLSNQEIGQIMGKSEGAVKSLYHRTLLSLRKKMEKKGKKG